jgi:hypothetical protein
MIRSNVRKANTEHCRSGGVQVIQRDSLHIIQACDITQKYEDKIVIVQNLGQQYMVIQAWHAVSQSAWSK